MFDVKQSICYPGFGARANEDAIGFGRNYCFAMDGASCLSGRNVVDPVSDAAWMALKVRDGLCALLDAGDPRPTGELLKQVMAPIRAEYIRACNSKGVEAPEDSPSAGFAMFRQRDGRLEFFGLGDCVGVAKLPDGSDFWWLDQKLPALDRQVLEKMHMLHQSAGISMAEAKKACTDLLIYNRNLRNTPDGYRILDLLSDTGIENATEMAWDLTAPVCVAAFSDGFSQLTEVFGIYEDYSAQFEAMRHNDLEEMFRRLCALQDADADCTGYPRFKCRDDTCALWGVFSPDE